MQKQKLYELIAVEGELKTWAMASIAKLKELFNNPQVFEGQQRTYTALYEDGQQLPNEDKITQEDVQSLLSELNIKYFAWVDTAIRKEQSNTNTQAEVKSLGINLCVPALLNLESKLLEIRALYKLIPTNDPKINWEWDKQLDCFKSKPVKSIRLSKMVEPLVKYEATKEHPAQVELVSLDKPVGEWETVRHSTMIQSARKQEILERINVLIAEVKQARQRANSIEVSQEKISKYIIAYIFG